MAFLFSPGEWLGEGTIQLSAHHDPIKFFTRWVITPSASGMLATQEVELAGASKVTNRYEIFNIEGASFNITMSSEAVGIARAFGLIEEKRIAWEFKEGESLQGFEVYEVMDEESYSFRAQFLSEEIYRTRVEGKIWKKKAPP